LGYVRTYKMYIV